MYDSDPKTDARIINAQQTEGARDKMGKINELDEWLEQQACTFNQGKGRAYNREYKKLCSRYQTALYRARELKEMGETAKAGELALKFAWERGCIDDLQHRRTQSRTPLLTLTEEEILRRYIQELRGVSSYYARAKNWKYVGHHLHWLCKGCLVKTLASKNRGRGHRVRLLQ